MDRIADLERRVEALEKQTSVGMHVTNSAKFSCVKCGEVIENLVLHTCKPDTITISRRVAKEWLGGMIRIDKLEDELKKALEVK